MSNISGILHSINDSNLNLADSVQNKLDGILMSIDDDKQPELRVRLNKDKNILMEEISQNNAKLLLAINEIKNDQSESTKAHRNLFTATSIANKFMTDLNTRVKKDALNEKDVKDNRKRIIQIQRNRIDKNNFITNILKLVALFIVMIALIMFIEKKLGKKNSTIGSGLIISVGSIFSIYLIFKFFDYNRRSKYNFRQINIGGGDNYDKGVVEYDKYQLGL